MVGHFSLPDDVILSSEMWDSLLSRPNFVLLLAILALDTVPRRETYPDLIGTLCISFPEKVDSAIQGVGGRRLHIRSCCLGIHLSSLTADIRHYTYPSHSYRIKKIVSVYESEDTSRRRPNILVFWDFLSLQQF